MKHAAIDPAKKQSENARITQLLAQIDQGDRVAFKELYSTLERPLYRFIQKKLNDPHRSSDILHDVFIEVWRHAGRFEGRSTAKSWIFGIANNKVIDVFRKESRMELPGELPEEIDESPAGEACTLAAQESAHIQVCLGELKAGHRDVVHLAFFEDMSYGDISKALALPEGTIKTRIFHAKQKLLHCLSARFGAKGIDE